MIAFGSAWVRYVCRYSFRSVGNSHWMIFSCVFFAEEIILLEKKLQVQNIYKPMQTGKRADYLETVIAIVSIVVENKCKMCTVKPHLNEPEHDFSCISFIQLRSFWWFYVFYAVWSPLYVVLNTFTCIVHSWDDSSYSRFALVALLARPFVLSPRNSSKGVEIIVVVSSMLFSEWANSLCSRLDAILYTNTHTREQFFYYKCMWTARFCSYSWCCFVHVFTLVPDDQMN